MFLGIDTSCYTTSLALVDAGGSLLEDRRILLPVPSGVQGLQQSTALFYHLGQLPRLLEELAYLGPGKCLQAVAVSAAPRPGEDSYMPVFRAGTSLARSISALLGIPLVKSTHQEGHLAAALWSTEISTPEEFLALHLSGGTTELLQVKIMGSQPLRYSIRIIGQALDIPAGQLVDRVGVAMGLPFPSGPFLEKLSQAKDTSEEVNAAAGETGITIPASVKGLNVSFSGAETRAKDYLKQGVNPGLVARAVEQCIANTVEKIVRKAIEKTGVKDVLLMGGVAANSYIRRRLVLRLEHRAVGARLLFPQQKYCGDNAVGQAFIARSLICPAGKGFSS